jgi:hypothetical protein
MSHGGQEDTRRTTQCLVKLCSTLRFLFQPMFCHLQDLAMGDEPRPLEDLEDDTVPETEGIDAHSATIVSTCDAVPYQACMCVHNSQMVLPPSISH